MSDGVNIDWRMVKPADPVGDFANAFAVGRQMAAPAAAPRNAMAPAPGASAAGDPLNGLAGPARAAAARRAELLANLATGLAARPYAERGAIVAHLAPALAAQGVPRQAIGAFDPTDEALAEVRDGAASLLSRLGGPSTTR